MPKYVKVEYTRYDMHIMNLLINKFEICIITKVIKITCRHFTGCLIKSVQYIKFVLTSLLKINGKICWIFLKKSSTNWKLVK